MCSLYSQRKSAVNWSILEIDLNNSNISGYMNVEGAVLLGSTQRIADSYWLQGEGSRPGSAFARMGHLVSCLVHIGQLETNKQHKRTQQVVVHTYVCAFAYTYMCYIHM